MKKYISLFVLPVFLLASSFVVSTRIEYAAADVPTPSCPTGSMRLNYGDGSTTGTSATPTPADPWAPVPAPAPNPNPAPAPINWDEYLDDEVIERYNRNPRLRSEINVNQSLENKLVKRAYPQGPGGNEDRIGGNRGGQALGGGPTCASWRNYSTSVAELACIVMQEQGGGPFCMAPNSNIIYNGLMDKSCRRVQGTQLAGFRIVATFPTYACGVPSPVTDG